MFNGWLSFAGNEILNEERVRTYAKHLLPTLSMPMSCRSANLNLAQLLEDEPYRTPFLDDAPWVDYDDPDSVGFCGAFPLTVQGLTDSTRSATLLQNSGNGGTVTGRRLAMKEVRCTALLIAVNEASLAYGKRWLSAALDGGCDPCEPADLCFLVGSGNEEGYGDYTTSTLGSKLLAGPVAYWAPGTGVFKPTTSAQTVQTPEAPYPLPCDEVFWHWRFDAATVGTQVVIETLGESGVTNSITIDVPALGGIYTISDRGISDRRSYSRVRVLNAPNKSLTIHSVEMEYRTDNPGDACFNRYARQLRRVSCISGPTTVTEYEPSSGAMEIVEFSFAAAAPHVYGLEEQVLSVVGKAVTTSKRNADVYLMSKTVPACTAKTPSDALVTDPDCPAVPSPPKPKVPKSSCAPDPDYLDSYALTIPDGLVPLWSEAVPILSIKTGPKAARKVQVRFIPRPLPIQQPEDLDPCSMCGEFVIDYIPPNSTFVLNGMEERAYIKQTGNRISDAGHLLSGMTSTSLFQWPVLTCGTAYYAIVDVAVEGVGGFDLSLAVRE